MQVFPGDPEVTITVAAEIAADGFQVAEVHAGTHTGTHLDAPLHTVQGGSSVDQIDLSRLVGVARIVRLPVVDAGHVFVWSDVEAQLSDLDSVAMVLFHTGWSQHFGTELYLRHPAFDADIALGLLDRGISVVGVDTLNPDLTDLSGAEVDLPFHRALLGAEGVIVENLTNLASIDFADPWVSVLPLPFAGMDGSPVRAVAMEVAVG
ncbi:cyclase family protein [Arthrobacter sp. Bz4]|uniref:cyclase family protein n=1 Tax=Arthrobacter sp. Bz4 TaxID=2171979 RepID=UPI001FAF316E|nr:cyclase family protein [Arthrobacter sp. Bz4]